MQFQKAELQENLVSILGINSKSNKKKHERVGNWKKWKIPFYDPNISQNWLKSRLFLIFF